MEWTKVACNAAELQASKPLSASPPTTLVVGYSFVRNIKRRSTVTHCYSGSKVAGILELVPGLLAKHCFVQHILHSFKPPVPWLFHAKMATFGHQPASMMHLHHPTEPYSPPAGQYLQSPFMTLSLKKTCLTTISTVNIPILWKSRLQGSSSCKRCHCHGGVYCPLSQATQTAETVASLRMHLFCLQWGLLLSVSPSELWCTTRFHTGASAVFIIYAVARVHIKNQKQTNKQNK